MLAVSEAISSGARSCSKVCSNFIKTAAMPRNASHEDARLLVMNCKSGILEIWTNLNSIKEAIQV